MSRIAGADRRFAPSTGRAEHGLAIGLLAVVPALAVAWLPATSTASRIDRAGFLVAGVLIGVGLAQLRQLGVADREGPGSVVNGTPAAEASPPPHVVRPAAPAPAATAAVAEEPSASATPHAEQGSDRAVDPPGRPEPAPAATSIDPVDTTDSFPPVAETSGAEPGTAAPSATVAAAPTPARGTGGAAKRKSSRARTAGSGVTRPSAVPVEAAGGAATEPDRPTPESGDLAPVGGSACPADGASIEELVVARLAARTSSFEEMARLAGGTDTQRPASVDERPKATATRAAEPSPVAAPVLRAIEPLDDDTTPSTIVERLARRAVRSTRGAWSVAFADADADTDTSCARPEDARTATQAARRGALTASAKDAAGSDRRARPAVGRLPDAR